MLNRSGRARERLRTLSVPERGALRSGWVLGRPIVVTLHYVDGMDRLTQSRRLSREYPAPLPTPRSARYSRTEGAIMRYPPISEPPGFAELSKAEQVQYLQQLWDSLATRPGELPVPESHLELVEERLAEYRRDPSRAGFAYDVIDRLVQRASKRR